RCARSGSAAASAVKSTCRARLTATNRGAIFAAAASRRIAPAVPSSASSTTTARLPNISLFRSKTRTSFPLAFPTNKPSSFEPLAAACEILFQLKGQLDIRQFLQAAVLGDGKLAQLIARVLQSALCGGGFMPPSSPLRGVETRLVRSTQPVVMYGKHSEKLAL